MGDQSKAKVLRRPKYPSISLRDAVDKVRAVYLKDGTAGSAREAALKHMGYKGAHGASITALSSLQKYGLTIEEGKRILLTKDALRILTQPEGDIDRKETLRRCALRPELNRLLYERYSTKGGLPSDDTLKYELIAEMGFSPQVVADIINGLRDTYSYADVDFNTAVTDPESRDRPLPSQTGEGANTMQLDDRTLTSHAGTFREYTIPRKGDRVAILKLVPPFTLQDVKSIEGFLKLMRETISDEPEKSESEQESSEDLKRSVESLHNCQATLLETIWVVERFQDQTVWEGSVSVFTLRGHPTATKCYAWSSPIEGAAKRRYYAVLHASPVESPADAVRAAIRDDFSKGK